MKRQSFLASLRTACYDRQASAAAAPIGSCRHPFPPGSQNRTHVMTLLPHPRPPGWLPARSLQRRAKPDDTAARDGRRYGGHCRQPLQRRFPNRHGNANTACNRMPGRKPVVAELCPGKPALRLTNQTRNKECLRWDVNNFS